MNLTIEEIEMLKGARNASEWNAFCDQIKRKRNGQYPPDWYQVMLAPGLMADITSQFS